MSDDKALTARDNAALIAEAYRLADDFDRISLPIGAPQLRALADALAEAQQRIEAALALHERRITPYYDFCVPCDREWPCSTVRALSASTAPETGIGAQQWGANAVSGPQMGSTAPETEPQ